MQSEVWSRVLEVWDEAKQVPQEELESYLSEVFADDEAARSEAAALLSRHAVDDSFLECPALARVDVDLGSALGEVRAGQRLGTYLLEEKIGAGGMGTVYRARRADGELDYRVAVKIVHLALIGTEVETRFRTERQILAGLDQPNIARFLDGGTTDSGLPYVVMELVSGRPITEFCRQRPAPLEERLGLFRKVCDAVHYAHRHLVVHRDLKPSNILVTDEGEPKLLDFGIAKLLEPSDPDDLSTATLGRALTPNYASPEQLLGGRITTASDIYSLGVVLHELLTGRRPYDWTGKTPLEVARVLERDRLAKPSTLAQAEGMVSKWGADLDKIVLKALGREPETRYASAQQMSEDLRRYLAGLPVAARPQSSWYRLKKFAGRNRWSFGLASLLVLSILLFAAFSNFQARRLTEQRDLAESQRQAAEEVTDFLEGVFKVADPTQGHGETILARELIDREAERVQQDLGDHPELQARLLHSLGWIYGNLGLYQEVQPLFERSLELRRQTLGEDHLDTAESLRDLSLLLILVNEHDRASEYLAQALAIERRSLAPDDLRIALTLDRTGINLKETGDYEAATQAFRESLAIRRSRLGNDDELVSDSLHSLADILRLSGDLDDAEVMAREALRISRQVSETSAEVAERHYMVGHLDYLRGRYEEAEHHFLQTLAIYRVQLGDEHPGTAAMLGNLAAVQLEKGDYEAAIEAYVETLEVYRARFGERSSRAATILDQLGIALGKSGELELASERLHEALDIRRELFGDSHPTLVKSLRHIAEVIREQGDPEQSADLTQEALEIADEVLADDHQDLIAALTTHGRALTDQGQYSPAEEVLRRAWETAVASVGDDHLLTIFARRALAANLIAQGAIDEGTSHYTEASEALRQKFDPEHPSLALMLFELADLTINRGDLDRAEEVLQEARSVLAQAVSEPPHGRLIARSIEGALLGARGPSTEAEELLMSSYEQLESLSGGSSPQTRAAQARLERYSRGPQPD